MLRLTPSGKDLLLRSVAGEVQINFRSIQLGNGSNAGENASALSNPLLTTEITSCKIEDIFITLTTVFSNGEVLAGFRATELGVMTDDPDNEGATLLYAYEYTKEAEADYIPSSADKVLETQQDVLVYIGDAENVTASISQSMIYTSKEEFETFAARRDNPHNVTAAQIGLGNVPNVGTNDQTPTYTAASTLENLISGEKISTAFGKIAKAVSSLIAHIKATGNVHDTKPEDIGAAPTDHKHSTNDITSGVFGAARGGTGKNSWLINRLIYPSATDTLAQLAFPPTAGSLLRQNTSGAPYWTSPEDLATTMHASRFGVGSYVGTGLFGSENPNSLTFPFKPKVIFIFGWASLSDCDLKELIFFPSNMYTNYQSGGIITDFTGVINFFSKISEDGLTIDWYNTYGNTDETKTQHQWNIAGKEYFYAYWG